LKITVRRLHLCLGLGGHEILSEKRSTTVFKEKRQGKKLGKGKVVAGELVVTPGARQSAPWEGKGRPGARRVRLQSLTVWGDTRRIGNDGLLLFAWGVGLALDARKFLFEKEGENFELGRWGTAKIPFRGGGEGLKGGRRRDKMATGP